MAIHIGITNIPKNNKKTIENILSNSFIIGTFGESVLHEFDANGEEDEVEDNEDYTLNDEDQTDNENQDTQDDQTEEENTPDTETETPEEDEEYELDNPDAQNQDQNTDQNDVEDTAGDEDEYTLDDPDAEPEGNETQSDDNTNPEDPTTDGDEQDAGGEEYKLDDPDDPNGGTGEQDTKDKMNAIAQIEKDLFEKLTPEQKEIKIKTLKQNYVDLYNKCDEILEMINNSNPSGEEEAQLFDFIQKTIVELQDNCHDYLTYTFDTKGYLDNDAQFKQYLTILNSIKKILGEFVEKKPE